MRSVAFFFAGLVAGAVLIRTGIAQDGSIEPRPERALNHVGIVVEDYQSAYDFYTGTLGLKEAYTVERNGAPLLTYLQLNRETFIELIPARAGQVGGITHFGIEVADIDAAVAEFRARGADVADPGMTPANARFVRIRDTDNVDIEIMEFGPDASQYRAMQAWQD